MLTYDEYMKQQKSFCDALEQLKQEVAQKRSDLAAHAKQTVSDIEPKIPKLQAQVNTLISEVARLEGLVVTTTKQSEYDQNYWKKHYSELEASLSGAYKSRMEELDAKDVTYNNRDTLHADRISNLESREKLLKQGQDQLKSDNDLLVSLHENFQKEKQEASDKINKIMASLEEHHIDVKAKRIDAENIKATLLNQSEELAAKIKEAEVTIATIADAQKKLDEARLVYENVEKKEAELKALDTKLDEKNVIVIADAVKNRNRSQELDHRELSLNQRESTLKIAQKELREGVK